MRRIKFLIKYHLARIFVYLFILPKRAYGLELGVRKGGNAKLLYYLTRPDKLVLVDSYRETNLYTRKEIVEMFTGVIKWSLDKNIYLKIRTSRECSAYIKGLDWIYIDANHEDLYNDLTYWFPNIKCGGVVCGDDYSKAFPKVKIDLDKFCQEKNLRYKTLHYQWWFNK